MALTPFQRDVCRLLAASRIRSGESYVAGGAALNEVLGAPRLSRDLDLFHDTEQALAESWQSDRGVLATAGYEVAAIRDRGGLVEAQVRRGSESVLVQWTRDSAFRFFPLVQHPELGLTLHAFDLATNKLLALVGRSEPRDLVDVVECHARLQPLGYLAWAACGKDPGFSPGAILDHAARANRYAEAELRALDFDGPRPDAGELSRRWHAALVEAREVVRHLPAEHAGKAVLTREAALFRGGPEVLEASLPTLVFHAGAVRGAFPRLVP